MEIKAYKLDTFIKDNQGGNAAGVVLDADFLSGEEMQKAAHTLGFSETAFVMRSNCGDFKVRFFTPNKEVDLCGHATVGTFFLLAFLGRIKPGHYLQETKAGILNVEVREDLLIMMNQPLPVFYETINKQEIADSLKIQQSDFLEHLPIQIVSTGLKDIMVPVKNIDVLNHIAPNFNEVKRLSSKYNTVGYHVFTLETLRVGAAHCRSFAPLYGIPEESATGTANGALASYLFKYNQLNSSQLQNVTIEQGYSMNNPSEIIVALTVNKDEIQEVKVGGRAHIQGSFQLQL